MGQAAVGILDRRSLGQAHPGRRFPTARTRRPRGRGDRGRASLLDATGPSVVMAPASGRRDSGMKAAQSISSGHLPEPTGPGAPRPADFRGGQSVARPRRGRQGDHLAAGGVPRPWRAGRLHTNPSVEQEPDELDDAVFVDVDGSEVRKHLPPFDKREASARIRRDPGADPDGGTWAHRADCSQSTGDVVRPETLAAIWTADVDVDCPGIGSDSGLRGLLLGRDRDGGMFRSRSPSVCRGLYQHVLSPPARDHADAVAAERSR